MEQIGLFLLAACLLVSCSVINTQADEAASTESEGFLPVTLQPLSPEPLLRIVGGSDAENGQFPYQVGLRFNNRLICGGSIISPNFIVTAAHCVSGNSGGRRIPFPPQYLSVRAGSDFVYTGGVVIPVQQVIMHPNFRNFGNDVALVKLSKPLTFSQRIRAIPLATADPPAGSSVIISGWGRLRTGGLTSTRLKYATLTAMTNAECRRMLRDVPVGILCMAHRSGIGACQGDSGGPAAYDGQLVGITNFVLGNCGSNAPDGFASITHHSAWIRQNAGM